MDASCDEMFGVLSDYDGYAEWAPDVVRSSVLVREGDVVVAEFLSPYLIGDKYVLEFVHSRPSSITYRQVDQYGSRGLQGSWQITAGGDGRTAVVVGRMEFRTDVWRRAANRRRTQLILSRRLDSLDRRVRCGAAASARASAAPSWSTLLNLGSDADAFAVSAPGARYLVTRIDA